MRRLAALLVVFLATVAGCAAEPAQPPTPNAPSSTSVAPTSATPAEPEPTTQPPAEPMVYSGEGDDIVSIAPPPTLAALRFECPDCTSNTVVKTDTGDLLVNEIGAYTGVSLLESTFGAATPTELEITATGAWTATVGEVIALAAVETGAEPISGTGDSLVVVSGQTSRARITNSADSNFVVLVVPLESGVRDLVVNEIGNYEGTVRLRGPAIVEITSSGEWTITAS